MPKPELYIGLMSGTSIDSLDCVLVDFDAPAAGLRNLTSGNFKTLGHVTIPISNTIRADILQLCEGGYAETPQTEELLHWAILDQQFAQLSAAAVNQLLSELKIKPHQVRAIGSHGQTIRHFPDHKHPHSLQLGDPNLIAELTGITVVADFRRRDIANGGQGAPLVPAFHQHAFQTSATDRIILNIGGISNITILPADASLPVRGFDTGPGNTLMDNWAQKHGKGLYDHNGEWAKSGTAHQALLDQALSDHYFHKPAPKSTGRELFNPNWLQAHLAQFEPIATQDVQATLLELTAQTIANDISASFNSAEVLICGGGSLNGELISALASKLGKFNVRTTAHTGLDPQLVEATAFAWLARQTLSTLAGNVPEVSGAREPRILGGIFQA